MPITLYHFYEIVIDVILFYFFVGIILATELAAPVSAGSLNTVIHVPFASPE
jgi:hypothetical protein